MSNARSKRLNETDKPILDMGIADAGHQLIIPQNTTVNLAEIPNTKVGSIAYDTTLAEVVINNGTQFVPVSSSSGASADLSNLTSPTAINEQLTFATGVQGGLSTANASGTANSGSIDLVTGSTVNGNSGSVVVATGTVSGTGTQGKIQLQNGSQGTAGQVWTSTDANGSGAWMPPGTPGFTGATTTFSGFSTNPTSWVSITASTATYDPTHMVSTSGGYAGHGQITIATAGAYLLSAAATSSGGGWTGKAQIAYSTTSGATSPSTVITTLNFDPSISSYQIMDGVQIVYLPAGSVVQFWALSDESGVNWGGATNAVSLI
jgi:hypothetical protein